MGDKPVTCKPHLQKWIEAAGQNPNPDQLYVVQANSFEDIKKRMEVSKTQAAKINQRVVKGSEQLNKYRQKCDEELQGKIQMARAKNERIS